MAVRPSLREYLVPKLQHVIFFIVGFKFQMKVKHLGTLLRPGFLKKETISSHFFRSVLARLLLKLSF
jgi:hypothetical protein